MRTWQPIETLDKKESHFVLVHEDGAMRLHFWLHTKQEWQAPNNSGLDECFNPTHWMPLPEPPKEEESK